MPADPRQFQQDFLARLNGPLDMTRLLDYLPEVYFYCKDASSRFVTVNRTFLQIVTADREEDVIGKRDYDFFPTDLAEQYVAEDRRVMHRRVPIPNQAWLVPDRQGSLRWYLSSKSPLFDASGAVIGIAGVMRDYTKASAVLQPYQEMQQVVDHVFRSYGTRLEVPQLARMAHLSISQFDRRFKQLFGVTPQQFILRVRIHAACRAITTTRRSMSHIAQQTGFCDQSYFTKQFRKLMGKTPSEYRRAYRQQPDA
jgi:PAS domain S-box-containing protein